MRVRVRVLVVLALLCSAVVAQAAGAPAASAATLADAWASPSHVMEGYASTPVTITGDATSFDGTTDVQVRRRSTQVVQPGVAVAVRDVTSTSLTFDLQPGLRADSYEVVATTGDEIAIASLSVREPYVWLEPCCLEVGAYTTPTTVTVRSEGVDFSTGIDSFVVSRPSGQPLDGTQVSGPADVTADSFTFDLLDSSLPTGWYAVGVELGGVTYTTDLQIHEPDAYQGYVSPNWLVEGYTVPQTGYAHGGDTPFDPGATVAVELRDGAGVIDGAVPPDSVAIDEFGQVIFELAASLPVGTYTWVVTNGERVLEDTLYVEEPYAWASPWRLFDGYAAGATVMLAAGGESDLSTGTVTMRDDAGAEVPGAVMAQSHDPGTGEIAVQVDALPIGWYEFVITLGDGSTLVASFSVVRPYVEVENFPGVTGYATPRTLQVLGYGTGFVDGETTVQLRDEWGDVVDGALGPLSVTGPEDATTDLLVELAAGYYELEVSDPSGTWQSWDLWIDEPYVSIDPWAITPSDVPATLVATPYGSAFSPETTVGMVGPNGEDESSLLDATVVDDARIELTVTDSLPIGNHELTFTTADAVLTGSLSVREPHIEVYPTWLDPGYGSEFGEIYAELTEFAVDPAITVQDATGATQDVVSNVVHEDTTWITFELAELPPGDYTLCADTSDGRLCDVIHVDDYYVSVEPWEVYAPYDTPVTLTIDGHGLTLDETTTVVLENEFGVAEEGALSSPRVVAGATDRIEVDLLEEFPAGSWFDLVVTTDAGSWTTWFEVANRSVSVESPAASYSPGVELEVWGNGIDITADTVLSLAHLDGTPIEGAFGPVIVHDEWWRTTTLEVALEPGSYDLTATTGTETATGSFWVPEPYVWADPSVLYEGYETPLTLTVWGDGTAFDDATTTVTLDGQAADFTADAAAVDVLAADELTFDLTAALPAGDYDVVVTTGDQVVVGNGEFWIDQPWFYFDGELGTSTEGTAMTAYGQGTSWNETTTVSVVDEFGSTVAGGATVQSVVGPSELVVEFGLLAPGEYNVCLTTGAQVVCQWVWVPEPSISVQFDDELIAPVPSGTGLTVHGQGVALDETAELSLATWDGQQVAGAFGPVTDMGGDVLATTLAVELGAGDYTLTAGTGAGDFTTTFWVNEPALWFWDSPVEGYVPGTTLMVDPYGVTLDETTTFRVLVDGVERTDVLSWISGNEWEDTLSLDVSLPAGTYEVVVVDGDRTATGTFDVRAPYATVSPYTVTEGSGETVVVTGHGTSFDGTSAARVRSQDTEQLVDGAITGLAVNSPTEASVTLSTSLASGYYGLEIVTGEQVVSGWFQVAAPVIRAHPERLYALPTTVEVYAYRTTVPDAPTIEVLDAEGAVVDGAVGTVERLEWDEGVAVEVTSLPGFGDYTLRVETADGMLETSFSYEVPTLWVSPSELLEGYETPRRISLDSPVPWMVDGDTVVVTDAAGAVVDGAASAYVGGASYGYVDLLTSLPAGAYTLTVTTGSGDVTGRLDVLEPSAGATPSRLTEGYAGPKAITINGQFTSFEGGVTTAQLIDQLDGTEVAGAIAGLTVSSSTKATVQLAAGVTEGYYLVRLTTGGQVVDVPLRVAPAPTTEDPVEPTAETTTSTGTTTVDEDTGEVTVSMPFGQPSDVTVTRQVSCPTGQPTAVVLRFDGRDYDMSDLGDGRWTVTIPEADVSAAGGGSMSTIVSCDGTGPLEDPIGAIVLYDPSGFVTDAVSGDPLPGATVTLYKVPDWLPQESTEQIGDPETCQSNASKDPADPWDQPAPTELGVEADPASGEISPATNPMITNAAGYYGWDVALGCWYVTVEADGYETLVSPVVGVGPPPVGEVTDLDLELQPVPDAVVPTWPAEAALEVTDTTVDSVALAWPVADDDTGVDAYALRRDGGVVAMLPADTTTYVDTGLAAETTYAYQVRAVDAAGNESAPLAVEVTTDPEPEEPGDGDDPGDGDPGDGDDPDNPDNPGKGDKGEKKGPRMMPPGLRRLSGDAMGLEDTSRIGTAVAVTRTFFAEPVTEVFVATALNYPDALAGAPLTGALGSPTLLVAPDHVPDVVAEELARLQPERITVLGGPTVVSTEVERDLREHASTGTVRRIGGENRFDTAALVAEEVASVLEVETVYLATGEGFADALAGGPLADDGPVLLVGRGHLPDETRDALRELAPSQIVAFGGPGAIDPAVLEEVRAATGITPRRWQGETRYDTGAAIASQFQAPAEMVLVATGQNFPDALAGGGIASFLGVPILLVAGDDVPDSVRAQLDRLAPRAIGVLGGPVAISDEVVAELRTYLEDA